MSERTKTTGSAVTLSVTCVSAYIACYILRNILSVVTPDMIASGYETEYIGVLSSVYYVIYACGQLFNGYVGEIIRAKYMVALGLATASLSSVGFAFCGAGALGVVLFGIMGFSLSMLRGPIVKTICENTDSKIAKLACVFLSFSSFVGPLGAVVADFWLADSLCCFRHYRSRICCLYLYFAYCVRNAWIDPLWRKEKRKENGSSRHF